MKISKQFRLGYELGKRVGRVQGHAQATQVWNTLIHQFSDLVDSGSTSLNTIEEQHIAEQSNMVDNLQVSLSELENPQKSRRQRRLAKKGTGL